MLAYLPCLLDAFESLKASLAVEHVIRVVVWFVALFVSPKKPSLLTEALTTRGRGLPRLAPLRLASETRAGVRYRRSRRCMPASLVPLGWSAIHADRLRFS